MRAPLPTHNPHDIMKKYLFITLTLLLSAGMCHGQEYARVRIFTDRTTKISVFGNIDGTFQPFAYPIAEYVASPDSPATYECEITDWTFLKIQPAEGIRRFLLLFPGDCVTLDYVGEESSLEGANAAGQKYFHTHWNGTGKFVADLQEDMLATDDYGYYEPHFHEKFIIPTLSEIDGMLSAGLISARFADVMRNDLIGYMYAELWKMTNSIRYNKRLTGTQSSDLQTLHYRLYEMFSEYDDTEYRRYCLSPAYISRKYRYAYDLADDETKRSLEAHYPTDKFASYTSYMLAPIPVRLGLLFGAVMTEYAMPGETLGFRPLDIPAVLEYMRSIAPQSEAVSIITELERQQPVSET